VDGPLSDKELAVMRLQLHHAVTSGAAAGLLSVQLTAGSD
jgi:hypothetical protein